MQDFAGAVIAVDARRPIALNQRSKVPFAAGIGPHTEAAAIELVMRELANHHDYANYRTGVPYPGAPRQKCDICLGLDPDWNWVIEAKLLRFLGDNGQLNDNMLMHILSPYPAHRSALTDCIKLRDSSFAGRKAIMIYGFEAEDWPLEPAIVAFEGLAERFVDLGERCHARFDGLVHPFHASGGVFAWELS